MTFACNICPDLQFSSAGQRNIHRRALHQETCRIRDARSTGFTTVHISANGDWPCPYPECSSSFGRPDHLQTHYKRKHVVLHNVESIINDHNGTTPMQQSVNSEGPQVAEISEEEDIPEVFNRADLFVVKYESMVLLLCATCNVILDGASGLSVRNHVRKDFGAHQEDGERVRDHAWGQRDDADLLSAIMAMEPFTSLNEVKQFFQTQSGLVPPVPGILIRKGVSCSLCNYHSGSERTMLNHKGKKHSQATNFEMYPSKLQCVVQGVGKKYFAVQFSSNLTGGTNEALKCALYKSLEHIKGTLRPERNPPPRELSPWLRFTGWSRFAAELIPEDAKFDDVKGAMVLSSRDEHPYFRLKDIVHLYANLLRTVLRGVHFNIRKMVMSPDSTRGLTDFLADPTVDKYCPVMTGFLLALLRSACDPPSNLVFVVIAPDHLKENLRALRRQLESLPHGLIKADDFDFSILHRLLLGLWTPPHPRKVHSRKSTKCVFLQYMILNMLAPCTAGSFPAYEWRHISQVTQMLSMLKFWCRAAIEMEIARKMWDGSQAEDMDIGDVEHLLVYLDESPRIQETPFSYICALQRLACTIVGDAPAKPQLTSSDLNHTWCAINGYIVTIDGFRDLVKAVMVDCTDIMQEEILLGLDIEWVRKLMRPGAVIVDDLNNTHGGYSFMKDKRNPFHEHENDLVEHLFTKDMTMAHFIHQYDASQGIKTWNKKALRSWMAACGKLEDRLNLLLHLTSGQPPRGEEYASFLVRNTSSNERSFYWSEGTIATFQSYNKSCSTGRPVKFIVRFLPLCIRLLFLQYLSLVRPAQVIVASILWGGMAAALYMDCWFVNRGVRRKVRALSKSLEREFSKHCNAPFRLRQYRHLAKYFCEPIRELNKELQKEALDASAGHSQSTAGHFYAQNSNDFRAVSRDQWRDYRFISSKWHTLLRLPTEVDSWQSDLPTGQQSSSATIHPHPAVEVSFWPNPEAPPPPKRIRVLHKCQGKTTNDHEDALDGVDPVAMHVARTALSHLGHDDWKTSHQAIVVALALDNTRDFLAILPTGSGKSCIFKAAALSSGKTVVVIVPLFVLIKNQLAECKAAGITCDEFKAGKISVTAAPSLVFVPVELAVQSNFRCWTRQLINAGNLHSIVIDEVHKVLCSYRPVMSQLLLLSTLRCQMIGLTASLPPNKEISLQSMLGRQFRVVRSGTTRPNLEYGVLEAADMDAQIADLLRTWLTSTIALQDRALVYCMTKTEVLRMQEYLEHHHFLQSTILHSRLEQEDRVANLQSWESGNSKIMIATGVIGCGYNYPSIRLVIHRGSFYSLEDYHQESGRAGRDGGQGVCKVVSNADYRAWVVSIQADPDVIESLMLANRWIADKAVCRRYNLHLEMDGKAQVCVLLPRGVECDVCSNRSVITSGLQRRHERDQLVGQDEVWVCGEAFGAQHAEVFVPRFETIRMERNLKSDIADLHYVRDHAGDGDQCLLCWEDPHTSVNHEIRHCPKIKALCLRCLSPIHRVFACDVKISYENVASYKSCYKCFFQLEPLEDVTVHRWDSGTCNDKSGERVRILIWQAYRDAHSCRELRRLFPEMPLEETRFEPWLLSKEGGRMLNNFVRVAAVVMRMKLSEI